MADSIHPQSTSNLNVKILQVLRNSRFPVFMAFSFLHNANVVMKIFYHCNEKICPFFINESRFLALEHPNIIKALTFVEKQTSVQDGNFRDISYILMEVAICDFSNLGEKPAFRKDEKLVRTYFHQLINAFEYLHSKGIAHLDIKPQNLLLGKDFKLKLADFDQSFWKGDKVISATGTPHYRAPELKLRICEKPKKSDIYSAGVTLFVLLMGCLPYYEDQEINGYNLFELMMTQPEIFWEIHRELAENPEHFSQEFKELFFSMTQMEPEKRISLEQIKQSKWYSSPIYSDEELVDIMKHLLHL